MFQKSYIYLWEGRFLYVGPNILTRTHAHHGVEIGIGVDTPFRMRVGVDEFRDYRGIIVGSDRDHECVAAEGRVIFFSLDPESYPGKRLTETVLRGAPFSPIDEGIALSITKRLETALQTPDDTGAISSIIEEFIDRLIPLTSARSGQKRIDERIATVMRVLKAQDEERPSLRQLADSVGLSGGRLVHLFTEQVGIPIRRYALWLRLNRAIMEIVQSRNLTEAAHGAGFSDSAHFSRTFLRMFGVNPSEILRNSQIVQAYRASL